jgi:phosphoribosylamine--glycine ligase
MNALLIGSGGREHALAWKLVASPGLTRLFIAPGNPGTQACGTNVALDPKDHSAIIAFCRQEKIGLVIVGSEAPLVAGLADDLAVAGVPVFGPSRAAAQLEGSKAFTKDICAAAGIPTARHASFTDAVSALAYLAQAGAPIVVKFDGLAAGKGVVVAATEAEAAAAIEQMFAGGAPATVLLEECLVGEEVSYFCLVDGDTVLPFGSAQDHKRVFDGDRGPNTGGMGAYSPAPAFTPSIEAEVIERIVKPTVREMARRGHPYRGVLFAGLMLTAQGPKLIEYNCRFGDPECQVLMLRLEDDLLDLMLAATRGRLGEASARWSSDYALTVVMAGQGYPGEPARGGAIEGLAEAAALPGVTIFQANTRQADDKLVADGGRVLGVSARGSDIKEAQHRAYAAVDRIQWADGFCRRDIGWRAVAAVEGGDNERSG